MEILLANPRGFCAGVERAIDVVERALERFGAPVYVRHEIVHNAHVIERLRAKGVVFVDDPADAPPGSVLIYSAHGVSPELRERAEGLGHRTIDATCPLVTKVHREAERFAADGFEILLVGHRGHVEVEGTAGVAPRETRVVEDASELEGLEVTDDGRLAVLTQTTLSVDDTREVLEAVRERFPEATLPRKGDICYASQNRQDAVKVLAERAELVLVVGAPSSSNANRLVEVARSAGRRARLIQSAEELDPAWLVGIDAVGVSAAASTPGDLVQAVVDSLTAHVEGARVVPLEGTPENVRFPLPPELR